MGKSIEEVKQASRKVITLPVSGLEMTIRMLGRIDFIRSEVNWMQPAADQKEEQQSDDPQSGPRMATLMQYVQENGVESPKVFFGPEPETPAGTVHESWIARDQAHLVAEILALSGVSYEVRNIVQAITKNE